MLRQFEALFPLVSADALAGKTLRMMEPARR